MEEPVECMILVGFGVGRGGEGVVWIGVKRRVGEGKISGKRWREGGRESKCINRERGRKRMEK